MRKAPKEATDKAGAQSPANPSEPNLPNLPDLSKRPEMVRIWKARGAALCGVCSYVMNEQGACVWDPAHKEQ